MKILVVEPLQAPYAMDVELTEKAIRNLVGEHPTMYGPFADGGNLIIYNHKDEGMPSPLPLLGPRTQEERERYETWRGTYIVSKISEDGEDFISLTDKELKLFIRRLTKHREKFGIILYFSSILKQLNMIV